MSSRFWSCAVRFSFLATVALGLTFGCSKPSDTGAQATAPQESAGQAEPLPVAESPATSAPALPASPSAVETQPLAEPPAAAGLEPVPPMPASSPAATEPVMKVTIDPAPASPAEPVTIDDEDFDDESILKVEDKPPYIPELVESEDIIDELEQMDYEEKDYEKDMYVFHVRIDEGSDNEIIAKIFRDFDNDRWTIRVVKGDEEPLESMEFKKEFDNLEIISYLANIYDEIEIIDPKEYEYLLDDKAKIDSKYYENIIDKND